MSRPRIIFPIFFYNSTGGAVQSAIRLMEFFSNDYDIHVVTVKNISEDFLNKINGYDVMKIHTIKGRISLIKILNPLFLSKLKKHLTKFSRSNDIIITNDFTAELAVSITNSKIKRINVARGGSYSTITGRILTMFSFTTVDYFIAISQTEKEKLIKSNVQSNKISIIPNALIPLFKNNSISYSDVIDIACIGYYNDNKNQLLALKAARDLINKGRLIKLNFYGGFCFSDHNYLNILYSYINEYHLNQYVTINDYTSIKEIYTRNHLVLNVSKNEGFGNTILEAMIYKRVIVTVDSGGLSSHLTDNYNAIIIKHFSEFEISDKIEYLLDNKAIINTLINNAYNFYLSDFSYENIMSKYSCVINMLINGSYH